MIMDTWLLAAVGGIAGGTAPRRMRLARGLA